MVKRKKLNEVELHLLRLAATKKTMAEQAAQAEFTNDVKPILKALSVPDGTDVRFSNGVAEWESDESDMDNDSSGSARGFEYINNPTAPALLGPSPSAL